MQVPHDAEGLAACRAAERLLPGVEPQVSLQVVPQAEALAALSAGVRPLPGVEPHVAPQGLPQGEGLGAGRAGVRPLSGVEALVAPQDLPPLERLLADAADVAGAGADHHPLQPPHAVPAGGVAAQPVARVGALVPPDVFGQRGAGGLGGGSAPRLQA